MTVVMMLTYRGEGDNARRFAHDMVSKGVVERIRSEDGNERYDYLFPMDDDSSVVLIDAWRDQKALDDHHHSQMMKEVMGLRERYGLTVTAQRLESVESDHKDDIWLSVGKKE